MDDLEQLVGRFQEVTGATDADARFYLSSTNGDLEAALSSYYEYGREHEISRQEHATPRSEEAPVSRERSRANVFEVDEDDDDFDDEETPAPPQTKKPQTKTPGGPRIGTMASLLQGHSSDEEDGQAFYAGGSVHSGQQVLGPPRARNEDLVTEMFRSVRAQGGTEVPTTDRRSDGRQSFRGVGYRLGQTTQDTEVVGRNPTTSSGEPSREVSLKLWKSGFTVDDGPLRSYTDPGSMQFLEAVRKGQVPLELTADMSDVGAPIHLSMEDRRSEEFNASVAKPKVKVFSGKGHKLGNPSPPVSPPSDTAAPNSGTSTNVQEKAEANSEACSVTVDSSQPTTVIRVRTLDGGNINITLNTNHTLSDLRSLIIREQPAYRHRAFRLVLSYPSRPLDDESQSIKDAGVCNSCILMR